MRPMGSRVFHACGWTDRHDEVNSRFSQIWEIAQEGCDNDIRTSNILVTNPPT